MGRTQRWVADSVGVSASSISAYERGQRQPRLEVAIRILSVLGHRLQIVPMLDPAVQARRLADVLTLAEALPFRAASLATARR
jgi:DNA-binding XRE family transcriptional regulator